MLSGLLSLPSPPAEERDDFALGRPTLLKQGDNERRANTVSRFLLYLFFSIWRERRAEQWDITSPYLYMEARIEIGPSF